MSLSFKIWNASSGSVALSPEWSLKEDIDKIWNLNRTPAGTATLYTYAVFNIWTLPCKYVPYSDAAFINSIFSGTRMCQLEVIEGGVSKVFSCVFMNPRSPFQRLEKSLGSYWQGEVQLSVY